MTNERLEFLGDAILGAIIADMLFRRYPFRDEGFLTEKSKYGRDNVDGKFGNLTKEALMDYNSAQNEEDLKGLVFDTIPQTIEEPRCAAGMCNILEMNNIETEAVGI